MLYFDIMQVYVERTSKHGRSDIFYMTFSTALLFLNTIFVATQLILGQEAWIINDGYPGGATSYLAFYISAWYQTMGSTASSLLLMMSDGLLVSVLQVCGRRSRLMSSRFTGATLFGAEVAT
jgi:hypothetical protein